MPYGSLLRDEIVTKASYPTSGERISVCHVASGDCWGGAESQIAALLAALLSYPELELSAVLFNDGELANRLRSSGIPVTVISEAKHSFGQVLGRLRAALKPMPSIIHSHGYKANLLSVAVSGIKHRTRLIRTQHGLPEPFSGLRGLKHQILQELDLLAARYMSDCTVCVSKELQTHMLGKIGPKKLAVVPNGIRLDVIGEENISRVADELGIDRARFVIGTIARLAPIKRLDIFLGVAKSMQTLLADVQFLIAGDGSELGKLEERARSLQLQNVKFLGFRNDVRTLLGCMDLFLMTSDHEGMPTAPMEALSAGVPVVARAVGGLPEIVRHGIDGILIDSNSPELIAEECATLLTAKTRLATMKTNARDNSAEFNITRTAERVMNLYMNII